MVQCRAAKHIVAAVVSHLIVVVVVLVEGSAIVALAGAEPLGALNGGCPMAAGRPEAN